MGCLECRAQATPQVPACASPSSTRARRPLGPCTHPHRRGECGACGERSMAGLRPGRRWWLGRRCPPFHALRLHTPRPHALSLGMFTTPEHRRTVSCPGAMPHHGPQSKAFPSSLPSSAHMLGPFLPLPRPPHRHPSLSGHPFLAFLSSARLGSFPLSSELCNFPHPPRASCRPADEACGCLVRGCFELTGDFCRLPASATGTTAGRSYAS